MEVEEAIKSYPKGQIFAIGMHTGWMWFGTAGKFKEFADQFNAEYEPPIQDRKVLNVRHSEFDPVVQIKLSGDEQGSYWCLSEWKEEHGETVEKQPIVLDNQGATRLAGATVEDFAKEYARHIRRYKKISAGRLKALKEAQSVYVYAWICELPEYFLDIVEERLERASKPTMQERDAKRAVEKDETYLKSDDFSFYCNLGGDYVINAVKKELKIEC